MLSVSIRQAQKSTNIFVYGRHSFRRVYSLLNFVFDLQPYLLFKECFLIFFAFADIIKESHLFFASYLLKEKPKTTIQIVSIGVKKKESSSCCVRKCDITRKQYEQINGESVSSRKYSGPHVTQNKKRLQSIALKNLSL